MRTTAAVAAAAASAAAKKKKISATTTPTTTLPLPPRYSEEKMRELGGQFDKLVKKKDTSELRKFLSEVRTLRSGVENGWKVITQAAYYEHKRLVKEAKEAAYPLQTLINLIENTLIEWEPPQIEQERLTQPRWVGEVVDFGAFAKWAVDNDLELVIPNQLTIKERVRQFGSALKIPGLQVIEKVSEQ